MSDTKPLSIEDAEFLMLKSFDPDQFPWDRLRATVEALEEAQQAAEANMAIAEKVAEALDDEGHSAREWRAIFEERKKADEIRLEGCRAALDDMTAERDHWKQARADALAAGEVLKKERK